MSEVWRYLVAIGGVLLLTGCKAADNGNHSAVAPSPTSTATAAPAASSAQATAARLSAYVGHYPFDALGGVRFLDQPAVVRAVDRLVTDQAIRTLVLSGAGPTSPITLKADNLLAWGCETHNCGAHNWTISIARDGGDASVCYHDEATMSTHSRWYLAPGRSEMRDGDCPSE